MSGDSPLSMMGASRPRVPRRAPASRRARRLWPIAVPVVVVMLAATWCALWYVAASIADRTLAGWVQREDAAGRHYSCGAERTSGFPFSVRTLCVNAAAALPRYRPPFAASAKDVSFTAQVAHPTVLVGQVTSPLTVAERGQPPRFVATWSQAQVSVSGVPPNPNSFAISMHHPKLDDVAGAKPVTLIAADDVELHSRIVGGSAANFPVIDTVLHFASAIVPTVHPVLAEPLQGDIEIVLRGLKNLSPKPLSERFREMQKDKGSIEIKSLRIARSNAIVTGAGTLSLDADGQLDGTILVAVAGLETIVPQLGIDKLIADSLDRLTGASGKQGLSALDRLVPGLSGVVRRDANAGIVDDLKSMGRPTEIDGKPATALPVRFAHGAVYLGIVRVGKVPPLF
jgi:hypothetical protein